MRRFSPAVRASSEKRVVQVGEDLIAAKDAAPKRDSSTRVDVDGRTLIPFPETDATEPFECSGHVRGGGDVAHKPDGDLVDSWQNGSWRYSGHANVWSYMAVDEELGLVYLPTGTPSNDWYGGMRPGNNLFAESIIPRSTSRLDNGSGIDPPPAARGESPASHRDRRWAGRTRREEGKYGQYLTDEQRRSAGFSVGRMQRDFHHGLLARGSLAWPTAHSLKETGLPDV